MRTVHWSSRTCGVALVLLVAAGQPAWAGKRCYAPVETWQPRSAVLALAERKGWHLERLKVDDGCYEIKGRDAQGRRFKAKIDPATLQILGIKREHGGDGDARERQRPGPPSSRQSSAPGPVGPGLGWQVGWSVPFPISQPLSGVSE